MKLKLSPFWNRVIGLILWAMIAIQIAFVIYAYMHPDQVGKWLS